MSKTSHDKTVIIGIPTFKRPEGLRRLLESIAQTKAPFTPHILVADSEGQGAGTKTVNDMIEEGYPLPLTVVHVEKPGISPARNMLLSEGFETLGADLLAMVDDDERVEPDWISELVDIQIKTNADIVWGYVLPEFETHAPQWAEYLSAYYRAKHKDGITQAICGTTSVLLNKTVLCDAAGNKNKFNHRFSLSGGGDAEYFTRLKKQGVTCAFASKAVSHEYFSTSRINKKWALKRAFRFGTVDMRLLKMHRGQNNPKLWIKELIKIPTAILLGIFGAFVYFAHPAKQMKNISLFIRQCGKIAGFFNFYGQEYETTHGK